MKENFVKVVLSNLLIFLLLGSCGYGKYHAYDVEDVMLRSYTPSHRVNSEDRYCAFYEPSKSKIKNFDIISLNKEFFQTLNYLGIKNLKEEELKPNMTNNEIEVFKNSIMQREKESNYKNCNYIIGYRLATFDSDSENACFSMRIYDVKTSEKIGHYGVCKTKYNKSNQNEYFRASILKWWEFQNTKQTKKTRTYECSGSGCRTIECIGDDCKITEDTKN